MSILDYNSNYDTDPDNTPGKFFWFSGYDLTNRIQQHQQQQQQQIPYLNGNLEPEEAIYDQPSKYILNNKTADHSQDIYEQPIDSNPYASPKNIHENGPVYQNIVDTNLTIDGHVYETPQGELQQKGTYFKLNSEFSDTDSENETLIIPVENNNVYEEPAHEYAVIPSFGAPQGDQLDIDYKHEALPANPTSYSSDDERSPEIASELSPGEGSFGPPGTWFRFSGRHQNYKPIQREVEIEQNDITPPKRFDNKLFNNNDVEKSDFVKPRGVQSDSDVNVPSSTGVQSPKPTVDKNILDEQFKMLDLLVLESFDDLGLDIEAELQAHHSPKYQQEIPNPSEYKPIEKVRDSPIPIRRPQEIQRESPQPKARPNNAMESPSPKSVSHKERESPIPKPRFDEEIHTPPYNNRTHSPPSYQSISPESLQYPPRPKAYQPPQPKPYKPTTHMPEIPKPFSPKKPVVESITQQYDEPVESQPKVDFESPYRSRKNRPVDETPFESPGRSRKNRPADETPFESPSRSRKNRPVDETPSYKDLLKRFEPVDSMKPQPNIQPNQSETQPSETPQIKTNESSTDGIPNGSISVNRVTVIKEGSQDTEGFPTYTVIIKDDEIDGKALVKADNEPQKHVSTERRKQITKMVDEAVVQPVKQQSAENAPEMVFKNEDSSNTFPRQKTSKSTISISVNSRRREPKAQGRSQELPERILNKRQKGTPVRKSKSFSHVPRKKRGEDEGMSFVTKLNMFNQKSLDDEELGQLSPKLNQKYESPTQRRLFGNAKSQPILLNEVNISPSTIDNPNTERKAEKDDSKFRNTESKKPKQLHKASSPAHTQSIDVQPLPRSTKRVYTRSKTEEFISTRMSYENFKSPTMERKKQNSVKSPIFDKKKVFQVDLNKPESILRVGDDEETDKEISYEYKNFLSSDGTDFINAYLKDVEHLEDSIKPIKNVLQEEKTKTDSRELQEPVEEAISPEVMEQQHAAVEWADLDDAIEQTTYKPQEEKKKKARQIDSISSIRDDDLSLYLRSPLSLEDAIEQRMNEPQDKTRQYDSSIRDNVPSYREETVGNKHSQQNSRGSQVKNRTERSEPTEQQSQDNKADFRSNHTTPTPRSLKRQFHIASTSTVPKQSDSEDFDYTSGEDDHNVKLKRNLSFRRSITIEDAEGSGHRRRKSTGGTCVSVFFTPISPTPNPVGKEGNRTICQQFKEILTYLDHMVITVSNFASDFEAVKRMHSLFWELKTMKLDEVAKHGPKPETISSVMNYLVVQEWPKIMLGCLRKLKTSYSPVFQECKDVEDIVYYSGHLPSLLRMNRTSSEFAVSVIFDGLLKAAIHFTDVHEASRIACCEDGLIGYLLQDVVPSLHNVHWGKVTAREMFLKSICELVYNCSQTPSNASYLIEHDCVHLFTTLRQETFDIFDARKVDMTMLLALSFLIDDNNYDSIIPDEDSIIRLLQFLDKSLEHSEHNHQEFTAEELASCLARIAAHDIHKVLITRNSGQEILHKLLKYAYNDGERIAALHAIWNLAFNHEAKDILRGMGKLKNLLNELKTSQDAIIRRAANGILWECEEKYDIKGSRGSSSSNSQHVMISYEYEAQPLVINIRDELHRRGYKVWMNTVGDERTLQEIMTRGVERATVVIAAVTRKYKQCPYTFAEIDYAHTLRKKIIPVIIDIDYVPDGWLSEYVQTDKTFDFSRRSMFNGSLDALLEYTKQITDGKSTRANSLLDDKSSGKSRSTDVLLWSNDDVIDWLKENQLIRSVSNSSRLRKFTGLHLLMFFDLKKESPDYYYSVLDSHLGFKDVLDTLEFTYALDRLLCSERLI